jgi:hypothetical protein
MNKKEVITLEKYWRLYFSYRLFSMMFGFYLLLDPVFEIDELGLSNVSNFCWSKLIGSTLVISSALYSIVKSESYKYVFPFR